MSDQFLFLSYKRGPTTTPAAQRLFDRAAVQLPSNVKTFFDQKSIDAGDEWTPAIDDFLAKTTLFLAFISIDYWLSPQCRRELETAIKRYERCPPPPPPRLPRQLFVLADKLDPNDLALNEAQARAQVAATPEAADRIQRIGQINFLGPHDAAGKLVRLKLEDSVLLDDQLADLVGKIKTVLAGMA